jgi:DNA/RNA-binding domain of Phe-tRNA-synthetase-like protein
MMFSVSQAWRSSYPGAAVGVLAMGGVANPASHATMDRVKEELEEQIRARFANKDELRAQEHLQAYRDYYKRFKKTYHVQLQLESIAFKGKSIPSVAALVEAMFAAELKNLLLTAGHDLDIVEPPVTLDVAQGHERYVRINGQEQQLNPARHAQSLVHGIRAAWHRGRGGAAAPAGHGGLCAADRAAGGDRDASGW